MQALALVISLLAADGAVAQHRARHELTAAEVQRAAAGHTAALGACLPAPTAENRVRVRLRIGAGAVRGIWLLERSGPDATEEIGQCVVQRMVSWRFRRSGAPTVVVIPILFSPAGPPVAEAPLIHPPLRVELTRIMPVGAGAAAVPEAAAAMFRSRLRALDPCVEQAMDRQPGWRAVVVVEMVFTAGHARARQLRVLRAEEPLMRCVEERWRRLSFAAPQNDWRLRVVLTLSFTPEPPRARRGVR
jgi:hypothetical protein